MINPPRPTSEAPFPHGAKIVCYFELTTGGEPAQVDRYRDELREAVARAQRGESRLFAVWPGQYRSDLFVVDDLEKLADAIGMKR